MIPDDTSSITQYAGTLAGGLIAFIFLLQKFFNGWKSDRTESSVTALMHTELQRMGEQNTKLSEELGRLQLELINMNQELRTLHTENQRLHAEVNMLTAEVARLQSMLRGEAQ